MTTKIKLITPIITKGLRSLDDLTPFMRPDLEIDHTTLDIGPASIESEFDEALSVPDVIIKAIEAEQEGAHAIIIDCMGDPGLNAAREVVSIPVIGPAQTAMHVASMIGHKFSVITVVSRLGPLIDRLVACYGLRDNYASFSAIDVPVLEIENDFDGVKQLLTEASIKAVREDGAGAIVLGCTGFFGCATAIRTGLLDTGLDVQVIDPIPLCVHFADALIKTGLSHSKHIYPDPDRKKISGISIPGFE